jgi:CopG family nickel-responsive transcriptional regulator
MQRVTISIDEELATTFDTLLASRGYQNRSEGVRDLVREAVKRWEQEQSSETHCVAALSYIFNPRTRDLATRLSDLQHAHHDLVIATTLVRLDHVNALECVLLRGRTPAVNAFADQVRAERGVRFGALNLIGAEPNDAHAHAHDHSHVGHAHFSPRLG